MPAQAAAMDLASSWLQAPGGLVHTGQLLQRALTAAPLPAMQLWELHGQAALLRMQSCHAVQLSIMADCCRAGEAVGGPAGV